MRSMCPPPPRVWSFYGSIVVNWVACYAPTNWRLSYTAIASCPHALGGHGYSCTYLMCKSNMARGLGEQHTHIWWQPRKHTENDTNVRRGMLSPP